MIRRDRRKIRDIWMPLLVYYGGYLISFFLLSYFLQMFAGTVGAKATSGVVEAEKMFGEYKETVTGLVNGISMLIGAALIIPMLREELYEYRREWGDGAAAASRREKLQGWHKAVILLLTVIAAIASSLGLNILLSLTGLVQNSAGYQQTVQRQYGVAFGIGLFLYTVVSPFAEEVVFRGVIYNRLRQSFCGAGNGGGLFGGRAPAILLSGLLFGIYHGNMVQGVYGCCMGVLISYLYEQTHAFYIPCLFHAAANCVVYLTAQHAAVQEKIFTVPCCVMLLMVTFLTIYLIKRLSKLAVCQKF